MRKVIITLFLLINFIFADSYQSYTLKDENFIETIVKKQATKANIKLEGRLHIRYLENNGSFYNIIWFEQGKIDRDEIDINSIHSPFLVERVDKRGFEIKSIKLPSKDIEIKKQLLGLIELMQFKPKSGLFTLKGSLGVVDINETKKKNRVNIKYLKVKNSDNITYLNSNNDIILDKNKSIIWSSVWAKIFVNIKSDILGEISIINGDRSFRLLKSKTDLPKNHWFFKLPLDVTKWKFREKKALSYDEALREFDKKHQEMLSLLNDKKRFLKWVYDNLDFLDYLDQFLENHQLEDELSKHLFSELGYINNSKSSNILGRVLLNENIDNRDRFRALMGLKNTSAPLDDEVLENILNYALTTPNNQDIIKSGVGAMVGAFAKERRERVPEQFKYIQNRIKEYLNEVNDKSIALMAVANLKESASDEVVRDVENILQNSKSLSNRLNSADAIINIGKKTSLKIKDFKKLYQKENNTFIKAKLIEATSLANDFKDNSSYKNELISIANDRTIDKKIRLSALKVLEKENFGKNPKEKKIIRKMMLGEGDRELSKKLKEMYRR